MSVYEVTTVFLSILGFLLTAFGVVMWSNFKKHGEDVDKLKDDLSDFKLHVANNHPTRDVIDKIFEKLEQIQNSISAMVANFRDRLDTKADK